MAERKINVGIEFAYASNDVLNELKRELEQRCLYQSVLIVDEKYEYSGAIGLMQDNIRCKFVVARNLMAIDPSEFDCIICINTYRLNEVKIVAKKNEVPYICILTKMNSCSLFNNFAFQNENIVECNFPMGIVLDNAQVVNKREFVSQFMLDASNCSFEILESKISNLFFGTSIDYDVISDLLNLKAKIREVYCCDRKNIDEFFNQASVLMIELCIKKSKTQFSVLDKLCHLFLKNNENEFNKSIEIKYIFRMIVSSLECNFFKNFTTDLKGTINYEVHQKYLGQSKMIGNFSQKSLPESKINFLLNEFRKKLVSLAFDDQREIDLAKNVISDFNIDYLYNLFNYCMDKQFKNYLSIEPDVFEENGFLGLMYQNGLLNFEI